MILGPLRRLCVQQHRLGRLMSTSEGAAAAAMGPSVAIVGGGISGSTCADALSSQGYRVTVFDMGKNRPGEERCALRG